MTALTSAIELAAINIPVFPCLENKRPATWHGFKDASTDPDVVRAMWRHCHPLVGVPTGEVSSFDVLDIDPRHGGERWWLAHSHRTPPTRMHRTRSGGLHVLFRHVDGVRNTESKLASGVDTRGEGGYVIWWPAHGCRVAEATIAEWPAWLLERLLARPERPKANRSTNDHLGDDNAAERVLEGVLRRVGGAPQGERHYTLRKAAYTIGGLLDRLPMGEVELQRRLLDAVSQAGAEDLDNASKTIQWAIECGRKAPLLLSEGLR